VNKRAVIRIVARSAMELALVVALVVGIGWSLMRVAQLCERPSGKEKRSGAVSRKAANSQSP